MAMLLEELIRSMELWLRLSKKSTPVVNPNLDPVILVPGIAGSILNSVDDDGTEERVWVRVLRADHEFRLKLWSRFDPYTGKTVSMDQKSRIVVPEDRSGLYAVDVLDPDLVMGQEGVYYYHDLIEQMIRWGYQEGITLFGFGYDFRQSNRLQETLDRFLKKLESVYTLSGGKKITLISHSMGGLLVKCFMCLHSDIFEKYVKSWITIATPFQGAPGYITAALLNGCSFVEGWEQNFFISKWSMQQLKCSPFAADLFDFEPKVRTVPILCNSSALASSVQSKKDTTGDYCTQVWNTCKDATIWNSPFAPSLQGSDGLPDSSSSKITSFWQSETDFCEAFGGPLGDDSPCFNGSSALFNSTANSPTPNGLCLEKIGNGSYLNMAAHPDGSNRVFFADQPGKIWLAIVPGKGSGGTLSFDESSPFLDITDEVVYESAFGVMGLAFHPNFATNGRFFVSYNCDKVQSASCSGRCSCNSDVDCDPSKLGPDDGAQPCQIHTVVAEYTANSSSSMPSKATYASPSEVRRIFTMGLPFTSHHGGQILFGPQDGYLYFMMGDGGGKGGDPYNFSQNKKSLLGKIMRLNIDNIPSESEIDDLGLWGNYSIPKDNPSADDKELQPEIWATGLRNPWRCSFDSERPSYFICADVGQDTYEEVDLISKGGNYGWRVYEGPLVYNSSSFPGRNTSAASINAIFPVMGYTHSVLNNSVGSASITGGYVYRSTTDPCMFGRYLYADLYAGAMWAGTENPENSGNYSSTMIPFGCSKESPIPCDTVAGTSVLSLGYIYSFGEDNSRDVFLLTSKGVYRVVPPSRCGYTCPLEKTSDGGNPAPSPSSSASQLESRHKSILRIAAAFLVIIYGCL